MSKELSYETIHGIIQFRFAIFDTDGTNLVPGVEIKIDEKLVAELVGVSIDNFEDMTTEEVENFLKYKDLV